VTGEERTGEETNATTGRPDQPTNRRTESKRQTEREKLVGLARKNNKKE